MATTAIEKIVPVTVTMEAAMAERTPRAPSEPPEKTQEIPSTLPVSSSRWSSQTMKKASAPHNTVPMAGISQRLSSTSSHQERRRGVISTMVSPRERGMTGMEGMRGSRSRSPLSPLPSLLSLDEHPNDTSQISWGAVVDSVRCPRDDDGTAMRQEMCHGLDPRGRGDRIVLAADDERWLDDGGEAGGYVVLETEVEGAQAAPRAGT